MMVLFIVLQLVIGWQVLIGIRLYEKLDKKLFPEVTFENSPMEVELVIKKNEKQG